MKKLNIFFFSLLLNLFGLLPQLATAQTTQSGQAIDLDGINDVVVISAAGGTRTEYTVQVRVKLTGSIINQGIILQTYTDVHQSWSHQIRTDANGHFVHLLYDEGVVAGKQVYGTSVAQLNQWYDITITCKDGGYARLYINGVEEGTPAPVVRSWKSGSGYFAGCEGGNNNNSPNSEVVYMKGQFDEIRVWDTELSAAQINQYKSCSLQGNYAGLQRCFTFNQGVGDGDNRGGSGGICWDFSNNNQPASFQNASLLGSTSNFVAPGGTLSAACSLASINVTGRLNANNIQNGSTTPDSYTGTDYEYVGQNYPLTRNFIITNPGVSDLTISNVTISGANASEFVITSQPASLVLGGQTTTLGIRFTPTTIGSRKAVVTITSNAEGANTFYFAIGGTGAGILPLTLTRFNAAIKQQAVVLNWETANEQSTSRFEVERSTDGRNYTAIATINAKGNSNTAQIYSTQDNGPIKGSSYYRLKMIDTDGKFTYSSVVKIDLSSAGATAVSIAPNPVHEVAQVTITSNASGKAMLKLISLTGQPVQQYPVTITNGQVQLKLERKGLAAGTYFYTLTNEQGMLTNGKIFFQ